MLIGACHPMPDSHVLQGMGGFETVNSFIANPNTTAEIRGAAAKVNPLDLGLMLETFLTWFSA